VSQIVAGQPRKSITADLTTCQNVQKAVPHQTKAPANACPMTSL
jgi:hypothetical protein